MFEIFFFTNYLQRNFSNIFIRLGLYSHIHKFIHQTILETLWTLIPVFIILSIAVPSFVLLYVIDVFIDSSILIKAIGHQWYWNYELELPVFYNKKINILKNSFDSYMINTDELISGQLRLLEVDKSLFLPTRTHIELLVTSEDVLHSFALPSAGIKIDAIPGRISHMTLFLERPCVLYGQCSELCGANHGFMPIKLLGLPFNNYLLLNYKLQ
jgi:heme/copper-type cytochrome/quinol oxidase subunit 2